MRAVSRLCFPGELIDISPALQQRPSDMIHPGVRPMVRMVDIIHHLFCVPPVRGSEWLIPLGKDKRTGIGAGVLKK